MDSNATEPSDSGIPAIPEFPPAATREYRATVTFAVSAVFGLVVGLIFVLSAPGAFSGIVGLVSFVTFVWIGVHATEALGLSSRLPWARAAMNPLLLILLVAGMVQVVLALAESRLHFPIGSVLAIWAFRAQPDPALGPLPPVSGQAAALIAAALVSAVVPFAALGLM